MSFGGTFGGQYGGAGVPGLGSPPTSTSYGNTPTANALINQINVYRLIPTRDDDGATQNIWTQIFTNLACSAQAQDIDREDRQGAIRQITQYRFLIGSNPGVMVGDRIDWTDNLGVLRLITVLGLENLAGRGNAYYIFGEEVI